MTLKNIMSVISAIVTIYSLICIFLRLFSKNGCKPCFTLMTKCFISSNCNKFSKLTVTYEEKDIHQISITTFAFWNSGTTKLSKDDYGTLIPYIQGTNGYQIIDYNIREINDNDFIKLNDKLDDGKLYLEFEQISKDSGFVIDVIHTGTANYDIKPCFKFDGIKCKIIRLFNKKRKSIFDSLSITMAWIGVTMLMFIMLLYALCASLTLKYIFIFGAPMFLSLIGTILNIRESYIPYFGLPKIFHKFFDEIDY